MHVLGRDHISDHHQSEATAGLVWNPQKEVATWLSAEQRAPHQIDMGYHRTDEQFTFALRPFASLLCGREQQLYLSRATPLQSRRTML